MKDILLGFEVGTGKAVSVKAAHIIVSGITGLSGKSTTLEAMTSRSGSRAIVFKTKVGEKAFTEGTLIPPYFKEKSDWQFVQSLLEAALKEKLKFERSWIIRATKGTQSLLEVRARIDEFLSKEKLRAMDRDMFTNLAAYLDLILPELRYTNFSKTLDLVDGINIVDLERFRVEMQHLIISSVMEEVLNKHKDTIVVMPEAWKHLPQGRGTPCKLATVSFIRQGATNNNYLWIDSQDITGVDKEPLKQVSTWILGLQQEKNEVVRTLDQVPLPKRSKPKPEDIMTLEMGHFFVCTPKGTIKIYVQPAWLDEKTAKEVAMGDKSVDDVVKPERLVPFSIAVVGGVEAAAPAAKEYAGIQEDLAEIRSDFFNKVNEVRDHVNKIGLEVMNVKNQLPDEDVIVGKVLQKMPQPNNIAAAPVNEEAIIAKVLARVPKVAGAITYEIAPLEKIQKDFLEEAKRKILEDISSLPENAKRVLKYLETQGKGVRSLELETKCFLMKHSGAATKKVSESTMSLRSIEVARKDTAGIHYGELKKRIQSALEIHKATEQEIQQVYDHVMMEMV